MSNLNNDTLKKNTENLLEEEEFDQLVQSILKQRNISGRRLAFLSLLFLVILVFITYSFLNYVNPIDIARTITSEITVILLAIFAVLITGYAIFQALVNGPTLITLIKVSTKQNSMFKQYNQYFFSISIGYLVLIIINFLFRLLLNSVDYNTQIPFFPSGVNTIIFSLLLSIYLTLFIHALIEVKSFIFNLYSIFTLNAAYRAYEHIERESKKNK